MGFTKGYAGGGSGGGKRERVREIGNIMSQQGLTSEYAVKF